MINHFSRALHFVVGSFVIVMLNVACGSGMSSLASSTGAGTTSTGGNTTIATGANVMAITTGCGYMNEPCVSVTICQPGTSTCQTIDNVLLDTGSYGLRLFSSAISLSLSNVTDSSGNNYAECVGFVDGSSEWGPVKTADIVMGSETASSVPIQVLDASFVSGNRPSGCSSPDSSPSDVGFNGILGVGQFFQDCGSYCVTSAAANMYYSCTSSTCTAATIALNSQVRNPVGSLPVSNNGVIVQMAAIAQPATTSSSGALILGIGTQSNNTLSGTTTFTTDGYGDFSTTWNGQTYSSSFIDSGSNGLFFPSISSTPACSGSYSDWFCPSSLISLSATNVGNSGATGGVSFSLYSASSILSNDNYVASASLGGSYSDGFDWGLPFFFGRTIAVGLENTSSNLGSGTYWAY